MSTSKQNSVVSANELSLFSALILYISVLTLCILGWPLDFLLGVGERDGTTSMVGRLSVLRVLVVDGSFSLLIVIASMGVGSLFLRPLRTTLSARLTFWTLATAVGVGINALIFLLAGCMGHLSSPMAWTLLIIGSALFFWQALPDLRLIPAKLKRTDVYWWLPTTLPLALALTVAALPPGILWAEEGLGYDVLEYHLGGPKEFIENGKIGYLPHNVYTNFPFNIEMLYLWSMLLRGDAIAGAATAKMLNVFLAVATVFAVGAIGRTINARSGRMAATLYAFLPFLIYLSGVAYVENGMLFFSAASLCCYLSGLNCTATRRHWIFLLTGLLVGFACGCKYPAAPMLAAPIVLVCVLHLAQKRVQMPSLLLLIIGISLSTAPWLLKNAIHTGNPVFPLANRIFEVDPPGWGAESDRRWQAGHQLPIEAKPIDARITRLADQVLFSWKQGALITLGIMSSIACCFVALRKSASDTTGHLNSSEHADVNAFRDACLLCGVTIIVSLYVWLFHTHLVDRFAVGLTIPTSISLAMFMYYPTWRILSRIRPWLVWGICLINVGSVWAYMQKNQVAILADGALNSRVPLRDLLTPHYQAINDVAQPENRVLLVGDARKFYYNENVDYCVTFNKNPFADAATMHGPEALMSWLRTRNYRYICVDWVEMQRLRNTYGFWPALTPDLFRALGSVGLKPIASFQSQIRPDQRPYATLFEITEMR